MKALPSLVRLSRSPIHRLSPLTLTHNLHPFPRAHLKMSTTNAPQIPPIDGIEPHFSPGYNPIQGYQELDKLLKVKKQGGKWTLCSNGMGIERGFKFKGFVKTWEFMNVIAAECKKAKHHPEWSNVYNTTFIRWITHSPAGISEKDIQLAKFCDGTALRFNEVVPVTPEEDGEDTMGKELADRVAEEGAGCCVPKPRTKKEGDKEVEGKV